jgi:hypothetical protein
VLAPAAALANEAQDCTKPFRQIGPVKIARSDIRKPTEKVGKAVTYKLDATWTSVRPRVSQFVRIKNGPKFYGSSFSGQKAISIDAYSPADGGWLWVDDSDKNTPSCEMLGRKAWQAPRAFVRETAKAVFIAAASQPAVGNHTGCVLGPDWGTYPCPLLTRSIVKLKRVVGKRAIILQHWGPASDEDADLLAPTATILP